MAKRLWACLIVWLLATALFAPGALGQGPTPIANLDRVTEGQVGRYGGTFVISQIADPRTFNPVVAQETSSTDPLSFVLEGPIETNFITADLNPGLAESWTVSRDGRTWTFKLREGVRWHDGRELTADDWDFTLRASFTEGVQSSTPDVLQFGGKPITWRRTGAHTLQVRTAVPAGPFLRTFGGTQIIPKHRLEAALRQGADAFNRTWGVNTNPREIIGTGPFVMQNYVVGQRLNFIRWANYWKVDARGQRLPYLTRFVILMVPNLDASRLKFESGETDFYQARPREYATFKQREKEGNYTIYDGEPTFGSEFVVFNQNPGPGIMDPNKLRWFSDVRFRRAMNHAIDRQAIINQVQAGRGVPAWGPISPANKAYFNPSLPTYPYDLNRAQQLLAEAGYRKGPDGVLRDAQGNVVQFTLSTNAENPDRVAIGNILRQDWERLGVRVTFAPEAFNSLVGKLVGSFRWEAIIIGLTGTIDPHGSRNTWHSTGSLHMWYPNQPKPATEWEAELDRIFDQASSVVDEARRRQLYARSQQIAAEQVPILYFAYPKTQPAVRNTLGNIRPGLSLRIFQILWNTDQIFYKQAYRQ